MQSFCLHNIIARNSIFQSAASVGFFVAVAKSWHKIKDDKLEIFVNITNGESR